MKSAIFLCIVLFCCLNIVRPAPAELGEVEPSLEEVFKRGYYYGGGYGRGYGGYGGYGYGGGSGNVFTRHCL